MEGDIGGEGVGGKKKTNSSTLPLFNAIRCLRKKGAAIKKKKSRFQKISRQATCRTPFVAQQRVERGQDLYKPLSPNLEPELE